MKGEKAKVKIIPLGGLNEIGKNMTAIEYKNDIDIFVHYGSIISKGYKTLKENDLVEFELVETDKGYQAKNVVVVEKVEV